MASRGATNGSASGATFPRATARLNLTVFAWVPHRRTNTIYLHDGINLVRKMEPAGEGSGVWALNMETRRWWRLRTRNEESVVGCPGPRPEHSMFVYRNALYLWGGESQIGSNDSNLYRLDWKEGDDNASENENNAAAAESLEWEVVETKSVGSLRGILRHHGWKQSTHRGRQEGPLAPRSINI